MIARHAALVLAVALAACTAPSAPTRFYALAPIASPTVAEAATDKAKPVVLGVGPVTVAEYLKRPQIVTRASATQLQIADFEQWIEPFDVLFPRVLAQDLAALLDTDRVSLFPAPRDMRLDFAVEVDVARFDAEPGVGVVLEALWRVYGRDGDRLIDQGRAQITRPLPAQPAATPEWERPAGGAYPAIVIAMSDATGDLARVVADAIGASGKKRK